MKRTGVPCAAGPVSLAVIVTASACAWATSLDFSGRASGWLGAGRDTSVFGLAGLRYLPEARYSTPISEQLAFDAEASVNAFLSANARDRACSLGVWLRPYRALARISAPRFYVRAGLQKVNFGSATLLRPLMWFDRVDPRDPLELTDGVYGLLGRYYFQNNTNVWAWGLFGNSSPKGWEVYGSERWVPEPGARLQVPVPRGEVAATYHHRRVDLLTSPSVPIDEDRVGLDGKWDVGVGCLFEATLVRQVGRSIVPTETWQRMATVGLDYTFGLGSALGVVAEHMLVGAADAPFVKGTDVQLSALMLSFPLGLLDNLRGMVYYDWSNRDPYSYLGWQRTLDNWVFSVGAFWNPDSAPASAAGPATGTTGKGVRADVVFNH
ncbi:hypothetical protein JXD38_01720 [candidate division WOR-3 bacterium]|nr:hypothetical protein [candidate division WOR-3 bacterium]